MKLRIGEVRENKTLAKISEFTVLISLLLHGFKSRYIWAKIQDLCSGPWQTQGNKTQNKRREQHKFIWL